MASLHEKAVRAIQNKGALLVYPLKDRAAPASLWSELHPRRKMVWSWDADADPRVARLWQLREELSRSGEVVYAKWFQNRATFFSPEMFTHLLAVLGHAENLRPGSRDALEFLQNDSPRSTKQIKRNLSTEGRIFEAEYARLMKPLWQRLLIVGFGELHDSSFPSLQVGATEVLFEGLWRKSRTIKLTRARAYLENSLEPAFLKFALKLATPSLGPVD